LKPAPLSRLANRFQKSMSEAFVIEVRGQAAGAVFRERGGYRFVAVDPTFAPLEGKTFASVVQAENSATRLAPPRGRLLRAAS
jgi:hypothetical protein